MSSANPTAPTQRSTFVTTLAWLTIVPAALGVLVATLQNVLINTVIPMDQMALLTGPEAEHTPAFAAFMLEHMRAMLAAFWLATVVSLASGIGLLRRKEWARLLFIALMGLSIPWNIGGLFIQQSFLSSMSIMPEMPPEFHAQFEDMMSSMRIVSIIMAAAFSAVAGWLIWRLSSEPIKAEFGAQS